VHYILTMDRLPLLTPRPPSALSRLALALALVLGAALAWAVIAELRFQRRTTERVSEDYLSLLARERVDAAAAALRSIVVEQLGTQVGGTMASVYDALPPAASREAPSGSLRCDGASDAAPAYFRIDLRDSSFLASPAQSAGAIAWVRDTIAIELQAIAGASGTFRSLAARGRVVIFGVKRAPFNAPVAVYGLVTCARALASVLTSAHARSSADSIISIAATIGNDTLVASTASPARALARADVEGIQLTAYPTFASPLSGVVIEREGVSSLALTLMLLGTLALASIAVVQLMRERRAVRRQAELVMTISHELRTPLAQILLYSETLALDRVRGDDAKRAAAQRIVDETRRLVETVSNVVGLTRPERGSSKAATLVAPVVESAITRVRALSDARARIVVSVPGALRVRLADTSLLQVLTNVLDNALKFGSATQTVLVSATREGSLVRIEVDDEGPGIPEEIRERVWARYFRANGDSDAGGAGIGLSIVRDIVVSAGGSVRAEDGARGGARIVLDLPSADDA